MQLIEAKKNAIFSFKLSSGWMELHDSIAQPILTGFLTANYAAPLFDTAFSKLNQSKQRIGGPEEKTIQSQRLPSA